MSQFNEGWMDLDGAKGQGKGGSWLCSMHPFSYPSFFTLQLCCQTTLASSNRVWGKRNCRRFIRHFRCQAQKRFILLVETHATGQNSVIWLHLTEGDAGENKFATCLLEKKAHLVSMWKYLCHSLPSPPHIYFIPLLHMQTKPPFPHERQPQLPFYPCIQPKDRVLWVMISISQVLINQELNKLQVICLWTHILPKFSSGMGAELPPKTFLFGKRKQTWVKAILKSAGQTHSEGLLPGIGVREDFLVQALLPLFGRTLLTIYPWPLSLPSGSFFLVQHLLWLWLNWGLERTEFPSCNPRSFNEPLSVTETWESESCLTVWIVKLFVCNPNLQFVFSLVIQFPQKYRIFLIYLSHVHPNWLSNHPPIIF